MMRIITFLLFLPGLCCAQPFPNAHAHNDYEHPHPLFDALHYGFTSVEADIFLIDGKLIVAHTYPILRARLLENLYLAPLDSLVRSNHGKIYPGYEGPFFLMIDIKSDGVSSYHALNALLKKYPALSQTTGSIRPVTIFISGNRPIETVVNDPTRLVALDGRPEDLGKGYDVAIMPVISDTYKKWSDWNGDGQPSAMDMQKIKGLAQRVHAEQKKLRLWAIPDNATAWRELLRAGVDFINTDHLSELFLFLKTVKK